MLQKKDQIAKYREVPRDMLEFQPDAVELEMMPVPKPARLTLHVILLLLALLLVWACVSEVDKIINAPGKVVSSGKNIDVSPLTDALIRSVDVKLGQVVKEGDPIVHLDPTFVTADATRLAKTKTYIAMVLGRLESELNRTPYVPPADADPKDAAVQQKLYAGRLEEYKARIKAMDTKVAELTHDIAAGQRQQLQLQKQVDIANEIIQMRTKVYQTGSDSRLSLLEAQNGQAAVTGQMEQLKGLIGQKQHDLTQAVAERDAFVESWKNDLNKQIGDGRKELDNVTEELSKATRLKELSIIKSPADAVVLDITKLNPGTVVKSGETILSLVPLDMPLEAEIYINTEDIGYVRQNDPCRIKLDTFPFQKYGVLKGSVRTIAEDAQYMDTTTGRKLIYQARVAITSQADMHNLPQDFRLVPGMTLSTDVKVGSRKVITYLFWPLLRAIEESIREP